MTGTQHACSTIFCGQSGTGFLLVKLIMMVMMIEVWRFLTFFYPPWKPTWQYKLHHLKMYLTIEHGDFPAIAVETGHIPVRIQSLMVGMTIPYTERSDQDIFTLQTDAQRKRGKVLGILLLDDGKGPKNPFCESLLRWDHFSRGSDAFGVPQFLEALIWFFYLEN